MKKSIFILTLFVSFIAFIACNNSSTYEFKDQIIIGDGFTSADTALLTGVANAFPSKSSLYIRITTKDDMTGQPIILKIQKEENSKVEVVFYEKKWFRPADSHALNFYSSPLSVGEYKVYLFKDGATQPITSRNLSIYQIK
jgi:hypothetical protein